MSTPAVPAVRAALAAALLALVAILAGCTGSDAVGGNGDGYRFVHKDETGSLIAKADRKAANQFSVKLLDGGEYKLGSDAGKVVLVNFWATWCGPCVVETPQLDLVYRDYKAKGLDIVGINTKDTEDAAKSFVTDKKISFPIAFDERAETALRLGNLPVQAMPFSVLIDRDGKVAAVYQGGLTYKDLEAPLGKLLQNQ